MVDDYVCVSDASIPGLSDHRCLHLRAFSKKLRAFKVPNSWEPMDLARFKEGLHLSTYDWPANENGKGASANRAKRIMVTIAQDPVFRLSASFSIDIKKNKGIEHLEHAFNILSKFGYWAALLPRDCNVTDVFTDNAGKTYKVLSTIHLDYGCRFRCTPSSCPCRWNTTFAS